jgi:transcriptional/translational regulatory protein YebC/TACO1
MDKNSNLPTEKAENPESPKAASTTPVESAKKIIDLNKPVIKEAITKGKAIIKDGKSKVEAAMLIFEALKDEDSEVIVAAFVQGAALTEKGAVTYFYNCRRKSKKVAKPA